MLAVAVLFGVLLAGCHGPDLVVDGTPDVDWDLANDKAEVSVTVKNKGDRDAGQFLVYVDADEDPVSSNHRPQLHFTVEQLAAGESITLEDSFIPLKHPANANLANVDEIHVIVDPKSMVKEKSENNNEAKVPVN